MNSAAECQMLLLKTFPERGTPSGDEVTTPTKYRDLERDAISEFFAHKSWTEVSWQALVENYPGDPSACLGFMTDKAFRYFLPAYLQICVEIGLEADVTYDSTIACLIPSKCHRSPEEFESLVSDFTAAQAEAIALILFHLSSLDRSRSSWDDASEALDEYWRKFIRH